MDLEKLFKDLADKLIEAGLKDAELKRLHDVLERHDRDQDFAREQIAKLVDSILA